MAFLLSLLIFGWSGVAQLDRPPEEAFKMEVVEFKPLQGHHFELNANQECSNANVVEKNKDSIKCQMVNVGDSQVELNICDDKKTFCKSNKLVVQVKDLPPGVEQPPLRKGLLDMKEEIHLELLPGFESLSVDEARKIAKEKKLPVLVMVSTDWCPPCNQSKEYLLSTPQFKEISAYILKIYVDGDSKDSAQWDQVATFKEFPSFILLNSDFEEVSRFRQEFAFFEYRSWWERVAPYIPNGYQEIRKKVIERKKGSWWRKFLDFVFIVFEYDRMRDLHFVMENALITADEEFLKLTKIEDVPPFLIEEWLTSQEARLVPQAMTQAELRKKAMAAAGLTPSYVSLLEEACKDKQEADCQAGLKTLSERPNKIMERPDRTQAENLNMLADEFYAQMQFYKVREDKRAWRESAEKCVETFERLMSFSNLKSPRYALQGMTACAKEFSPKKVDEIFMGLIKQYPDDSTFLMRYARFLKDDPKKLAQAKVWAEKAMSASYDFNWFSSATIYIQICKALGQNEDALKVIREAYARLRLGADQESREHKLLARFRDLEREIVAK